jgi:hypothetical protein
MYRRKYVHVDAVLASLLSDPASFLWKKVGVYGGGLPINAICHTLKIILFVLSASV